MSSYKRLEAAYKLEKKTRESIEHQYNDAKKLSSAISRDADTLINKLKESITRLQNESKELQSLYEQSEKKLNMMQHLTSIVVDTYKEQEDPMEADDNREDMDMFSCRVYGKANPVTEDPAIEFVIGLSQNEIEYSPIHIRTDIRDTLPEYIREAIVFDIPEAPLLISQIMGHVTGCV